MKKLYFVYYQDHDGIVVCGHYRKKTEEEAKDAFIKEYMEEIGGPDGSIREWLIMVKEITI